MIRGVDAREQLAWTVFGTSGDVILWLHGYTLDSSIWADLWPLLPGYRHLGLDLPGHGRSRPLGRSDTVETVAHEIIDVARRHEAKYLIGISFGGMIALQVAARAPQQFCAVVLGAPLLAGGPVDPQAQACNLALFRLYKERGRGPWLRDRWMSDPPRIFSGTVAHPELRRRLATTIDGHSWEELSDGRLRRFSVEPQSPDLLGRITAPTLVVIGEDEMPSFKRCAELVVRALPCCRRESLPGGGHLALLELPQVAAPLIASHLSVAAQPRFV